jgi:ABC-type Fe3+-hydroxamate transport system substrate-binding protein
VIVSEQLRVVSLVPSATETLLALGVEPVACTRFCLQPGIATVGGTKNPRVDDIVALAPDLVVVNDEENRREDADALTRAGLALHDMSPRSVADVGPSVVALALAVAVPVPADYAPPAWDVWLADSAAGADGTPRAAVLVWRRPWMAIGADTYGSSVLEHAGFANVYAEPGSDRYPEVSLDAVAARRPDVVLLPSEPYRFRERHVDEVARAVPGARVLLADGQDLFWWGIRTREAVARVRGALTD